MANTGIRFFPFKSRHNGAMDAIQLRRCVWDEMLYADMRANYFGELVQHYLKLDWLLRMATLVAASGTLLTALAQAPAWLRVSVPVIATAISFLLLLRQYGSLSRDAADLHASWLKIHQDYKHLWNHLDMQNAEDEFLRIGNQSDALSKSGTKFPAKEKRLGHWLDRAAEMANPRYA